MRVWTCVAFGKRLKQGQHELRRAKSSPSQLLASEVLCGVLVQPKFGFSKIASSRLHIGRYLARLCFALKCCWSTSR